MNYGYLYFADRSNVEVGIKHRVSRSRAAVRALRAVSANICSLLLNKLEYLACKGKKR